MDGSYPDKIVKLKARSGQDCGEFRSNGCQSVISGIHPDGHSYKITKKSPPVKIRYSEIKWPVEITPPLQPFTSLGSHSFPSVVIRSHLLHANESEECERLVQESIPSGKGQNHRNLFDLARRLKGMEQRTGTAMTVDQQKAVFSIWHKQAAEFLRPGQSFDEYFFEFLDAWERVRYPAGEAVLTGAWERAQKTSPPEASLVDDPDIRRLVSLCWELQLRAGNRPFILPCRVVQRLFHHENHVRGWRWLQGLCRLKVLDMVKAGNSAKRECSKYRYLFTPQSTTNRKEI